MQAASRNFSSCGAPARSSRRAATTASTSGTGARARPSSSATSAISSGVAATSFWPIDAWASLGVSCSKSVGNTDAAGSGRSNGGAALKPKASDPSSMMSGPSTSAPISAKAVLQDTTRISGRAPPQLLPPKLRIGTVVRGGTY